MTQDRTANFFNEITHNIFVFANEGCFFDSAADRFCYLTGRKSENFDLRLKRLLREYIYARYYSHDNERAEELMNKKEAIATIVDREEPSLGRLLAESCGDCHIYDQGWAYDICPGEEGVLLAKKSGVQLKVEARDVVVTACGERALRMPAVRRFVLPGWVVLFGETASFNLDQGCGRHYFPARNAPTLISMFSEIAHYMNEMRYPFQLKAVNNSSRIERTDNLVLFTPKDLSPEELAPLHEKLLQKYSSEMKAPPPMTRYMGLGWGFAEESLGNNFERTSFGQERCDIIAKAMIESDEDSSAEDKLKRIKHAFADNGLAFDKPYARRSEA